MHAIATPLITRADGTKYGKTEAGALWLDPTMLSPYGFFQFWLNVEDEKVGELLRAFTLLSHAEIEDLEEQTAEEAVPPGRAEGARRAHDVDGARGDRDPADPGRVRGRSAVTASTGTCTSAPRPFSFRYAFTRSPTIFRKSGFVGPRFEPLL